MHPFANYFWGEKNNGFDVLYHNMKDGLISIREFEDFLRESCALEDSYTKLQAKLAKFVSNFGNRGSFGPFWQVVKTLAEKLSSVHQQLSVSWQDLNKEVHRYNLEQQKRQREVKEQEASTLDAVQSLQQTIVALHKAKEGYHAKCFECEKLRRESAPQKELERAEMKLKRANDDYRGLIDKYATVRVEFEQSMMAACKRFQDVEEKHLSQLKEFVESYCRSWRNQYAVLGQVYEEFQASGAALTVDKIIETFVLSKTTGTEKPGPIEFVEADLSSLAAAPVSVDLERRDTAVYDRPRKDIADDVPHGSFESTSKVNSNLPSEKTLPMRGSHWILSISKVRRNKKKKEAQEAKKSESDPTIKNANQVDDEGYSVPPETPHQNNGDSFYSSSDSDTDAEDRSNKIKVEIKPITSPNDRHTPDNVADIRNLVKTLRLSPPANRKTPPNFNLKLSSSMLDGMSSSSKPSEDLIGLDLFSPLTAATTPNCSDQKVTASESMPSMISASSLLMSSPDDMSFIFPNKPKVQTPTGTSSLLPGPIPLPRVSRSSNSNLPLIATARPTGRQTPDLFRLDRAESATPSSSISFASSASFGMSRGPSPLTIGMSDAIPLAVAFSETVNAYFKGSDQSRCRVRMTGDLVLSFPAGIIRVLRENPYPTPLRFCIKNISNLEQILVNKQLISECTEPSSADCKVYCFEMTALSEHLRRQVDQNRNATYFNIDILKYQIKSRPGFESTPLFLASTWKCEPLETEVAINYSYNSSAMSSPVSLTNIVLTATVDGQIKQLMQSSPAATWSAESKRIVWKLGEISDMSENGSHGRVLAKFDLISGPSTPSLTAAQFLCDGTTLSGIDFELAGPGYRLSLVKKRFFTGKYISESDALSKVE